MHIALDFITMTFITNNVILGYGKFEMLKVPMPALVLIYGILRTAFNNR